MSATTTVKLHTGQEFPLVGLGTWQSKPGEVATALTYAIERANYRNIDCAMVYLNETEIGDALSDILAKGVVKREELFITSKLFNTNHHREHVRDALVKTLKDLKLDYLDLYLMHWPIAFKYVPYDKERRGFDESFDPLRGFDEGFDPNQKESENIDYVPIRETWEAMEALVEEGLVKAIGISNFTVALIQDLLSYAKIKPAVNQIELHPYLQQSALVKYCQSKNIVISAYSPLGSPGYKKEHEPTVLDDPVLAELATKYGKSVGQIALRWNVQRGVVVLPKSVNPQRLESNADLFGFELSAEDMEKISKIDKGYRYFNPATWYGLPIFD